MDSCETLASCYDCWFRDGQLCQSTTPLGRVAWYTAGPLTRTDCAITHQSFLLLLDPLHGHISFSSQWLAVHGTASRSPRCFARFCLWIDNPPRWFPSAFILYSHKAVVQREVVTDWILQNNRSQSVTIPINCGNNQYRKSKTVVKYMGVQPKPPGDWPPSRPTSCFWIKVS